ncbi:hypothetical protein [Zhongshania aliphaticivorans]|uniref:hypothetical protein n=1 Tax=Zhongshania aliphaticivorans TaxID=1470434 RepID=UPI0012E4ADA3|nr:hypothetical protein [Zhongshania aliphaticivorans]CAA0078930.1 Uncharacterised protein [Zhongshania aliphaticivorans]
MINRCCVCFLLSIVLVSCGEKPKVAQAVEKTESERHDNFPLVDENAIENTSPEARTVEESVQNQPVLDLSLPSDLQDDVQNWGEEKSRYGVEAWFEQSGQSEEQRLKIKTKLRMKEGAEFDRNSNFSSYGDSVDGAEMGFEYKTR